MHDAREDHRIGVRLLRVAGLLDELRDQLERLLRRDADGDLRAAEPALLVCGKGVLHLVEHRCLQVGGEAGVEELRRDAHASSPARGTASRGLNRRRPARSGRPCRSIFTWKCRWPGSTPSRWASSRFVIGASPSAPSISSTRRRSGMAERLELLRSFEREDVGGAGTASAIRRIYRSRGSVVKLAAAARSRRTIVSPCVERTRLAGTCGSGGPAKARATASAFSAPARGRHDHARATKHRKRHRDPLHVVVAAPPTARRSRSSRAGASGKREAVWPSGPMPWKASPSVTPVEQTVVLVGRRLAAELSRECGARLVARTSIRSSSVSRTSR